ncbi:hypothetical protein SALBM135S_09590 [Streptomyces alboniger]
MTTRPEHPTEEPPAPTPNQTTTHPPARHAP